MRSVKRLPRRSGGRGERPKPIPAKKFAKPTLRRAWPRDQPEAAMCVQGVDVQCVLQFTLIHAAGCALHRRASRVIHCPKLFQNFVFYFPPARRRSAIKTEWLEAKNGLEEKRFVTPGRAAARAEPLFQAVFAAPAKELGERAQSAPGRERRGAATLSRPRPVVERERRATLSSSPRRRPRNRGADWRATPGRTPVANAAASRHFTGACFLSFRFPMNSKRQTIMILPQVHLRKPCYDFYFLQAIEFERLLGARAPGREPQAATDPMPSLNRSIDSSDGRCVQRTGT